VGLLNPHLDDDAFAEVWTERATLGQAVSGAPPEKHLQSCADCRERYAAFATWLETVRSEARAEADEAFSAERFATQQAQIARRLEALEHPARVIAFPRFARPISAQQDPRRRWVAAAAAAGLVIGVGLGQLLEFRTSPLRAPEVNTQPQVVARGALPPSDQVAANVQTPSQASDELFLYDQEIIPAQVRVPESLQYLNAITPGPRDIDPR
jgi:hypothetical protein